MSDAQQDRSEHARTAANARWTGQVASRAADTIVERAADLGGESEDVMQAVSRVLPGWIPARSARMIANEDRVERQQARAEQRDREARAEASHDRAVAAYMADAVSRGEDVSPLDAATGGIGRTVADVLAGAAGEIADRVPKGERGERDYELMFDGEPVIRSARLPVDTGYETDSLIGRASDLHRDLQRFKAKHDYREAARAARAQSTAQTQVVRSGQGSYPSITRGVADAEFIIR